MSSEHGQSTLLLSVIVPVYNAAQHLARCMDSVQRQDLPSDRYEVLAVDDGSTDRSAAILSRLAARYPNLRVLSQRNLGPGMARNLGLQHARGRFIHFVDADDYVADDVYTTLIGLLESGSLDALYLESAQVTNAGVSPALGSPTDPPWERGPVFDFFGYIKAHRFRPEAWIFMYRRSLFADIEAPFPPGVRCLEDLSFTLETLLRARRIARWPQPVYARFVNPDSLTNSRDPTVRRSMVEGFLFNVDYLDGLIGRLDSRVRAEPELAERLYARRDSYAFFLMMRLLRGDLPFEEIGPVVSRLEARGVLPLRRFISRDYRGWRYRMLVSMVNRRRLFMVAARVFGGMLRRGGRIAHRSDGLSGSAT